MPAMWKVGSALNITERSPEKRNSDALLGNSEHRFTWLSSTPFGKPVVPDEYSCRAVSFTLALSSSPSAPKADRHCAKSVAPSLAWVAITVQHAGRLAFATAGRKAGSHIRTFAWPSLTIYSISGGARRQLMGMQTAPILQAPKVSSTHST